MRTIGIGILLVLLSVASFAQQGIRITVVDRSSGEVLPFAYVNVYALPNKSAQNTLQANENGVVTVYPESYPCEIEVSMMGYDRATKSLYSQPANTSMVVYMTQKYASVEQVVVTGNSQPTKMKDALSVYRVIPKAQIKAQGAVTLEDIMKNQLNMRVGNDQILGSSLSMQGMTGDKVKILVDGIPINGREDGNINLGQINLNNVERIEMIQGPMSVVYGTDALGGVINIITKKEKKPLAINFGTYYESLGRYNFDGSASFRLKDRHQITLGGGRNFFQGWKYIDSTIIYDNEEITTKRNLLFNPIEQYVGNAAYRYTAPSGFNLNFASDYLDETVTDKGDLYIWTPYEANAIDRVYHTTRSTNRLSLGGKLGNSGTWTSQNGYVVYNRKKNMIVKDLVTLNEQLSGGKGDQDTSSFKDFYFRGSYTNAVKDLNYTVGYDVNLQYATSLKLEDGKQTLHDYALYLNASYPIIKDKLTAQGGLRGAINSIYNPPLIPSFNLLYKPTDKVQVRGSYAKGFRAPSLKERYLTFIDANHYIIGNDGLDAETSQHIQASASYQVYQNKADYLQFIVTGFYNDVRNGITLVPIRPDDTNSIDYTYGNLARAENAILSLQSDGQYKNLHFQLGYSYSYAFAQKGLYSAFPAQEATATLQYALRKLDMNLNLFYKYAGRRPLLTIDSDGNPYYRGEQQGYSIFDVSMEKSFWDKKIQLVVGMKNVLDVQRVTTTSAGSSGGGHSTNSGGINLLPRSVFTTLRIALNKY